MISFKNLSVRWKVSLPMVIVILLMVTMVGVGLGNISSLSDKVKVISHNYLPSIDYVIQADRDLYQALVAERSMIFVDAKSEHFSELKKFHQENIEQAKERVEKFAALTISPEAQQYVRQFRISYDTWIKTSYEIARQRASDTRVGRSTAIDLSFKLGAEQFSAMRDNLDKLEELLLEVADLASQETDETVSASRTKLFTALIIGLAVSCIFVVFAPGLITRPLASLSHNIRRLSEGDLNARVNDNSKDEFGLLGRTFNECAMKQQELIRQVKFAVDKLRDSASHLAVVAEQTRDGVKHQKIETELVATSMNEMSNTVQEVAQNAIRTAQSASEANDQVSSGKATVEATIMQISELAEEVEHSASVIERLKAESINIGGVLDVIRNIAEQTNLLALNAAIEAARAGEQGRGFAVVADEVRTLANRTHESTQEIEAMIGNLQSGAQEAVRVMATSRERTHETVRAGNDAGELLESVVHSVATIRDMNHHVAGATEEQSRVTDEINQGVIKIHKVAEEASAGADQTAQASAELANLGEALQQLVSNFRIGESA